jgi:hypothetical protein
MQLLPYEMQELLKWKEDDGASLVRGARTRQATKNDGLPHGEKRWPALRQQKTLCSNKQEKASTLFAKADLLPPVSCSRGQV